MTGAYLLMPDRFVPSTLGGGTLDEKADIHPAIRSTSDVGIPCETALLENPAGN